LATAQRLKAQFSLCIPNTSSVDLIILLAEKVTKKQLLNKGSLGMPHQKTKSYIL